MFLTLLNIVGIEAFTKDWVMVGLSFVVGLVAIGGMFLASRVLSSRRHSAIKLSTYECGIPATPFSWSTINLRFYIFAIMFLIFDVEAVFLFPWAVSLGSLGSLGFWSMMIFLFVLTVGFIYEWKKGALDWD